MENHAISAAIPPKPEWRSEVARRLGNYRARRRQLPSDTSQPELPFLAIKANKQQPEEPRERLHPRVAPRQHPAAPMEICVQPELDFENASDDRARPQTALVPVASLIERRRAGAFDGVFIALTSAAFIVLFHSLGGEIVFSEIDAIVYGASLYLFYGLYFSIFTTLAGSSPGMQLSGLTVVRLDGSLPDTRQLFWRSFGYLLSGATLFLGFLWALWDEDHFTWQDRISQTYITAASPFYPAEPAEIHPVRRALVRR